MPWLIWITASKFDRSGWTYNNTLRILRMVWKKMIDRGYVNDNPFLTIESKRKLKKNRRNFSHQEAKTVIEYIKAKDPLLFIALLLEYACLLRPSEMRKLRIGDFDLKAGTIKLDAWQTKTGEPRLVTIPDAFLKFFICDFLLQYPLHYFLFG